MPITHREHLVQAKLEKKEININMSEKLYKVEIQSWGVDSAIIEIKKDELDESQNNITGRYSVHISQLMVAL